MRVNLSFIGIKLQIIPVLIKMNLNPKKLLYLAFIDIDKAVSLVTLILSPPFNFK